MKEAGLREVISNFSGNIQAAHTFARYLKEEFEVDLDINFDSTNSLQRFTNIVRNMITRNVIQKPRKAGRTLIMDERSFLQLVVARMYLAAGCSLDSLAGYMVDMPTNDIYDRLFAETQLPDVSKLTEQLSDSTKRSRGNASKSELGETNPRLYHHVKVDTGLFLLAKAGEYEELEVLRMVALLKDYLDDRAKLDLEQDEIPAIEELRRIVKKSPRFKNKEESGGA